MEAASPRHADYWKQQIENALLAPVRAMRLEYLPLLMVYFAYGAMGLTAVAESFWIKKDLTWTPAELSALAVWFSLPWTMKMVFGELVDTVPLLGSQRRAYVFVGASLIAVSFVLLAGAAGGWITAMAPDRLYVAASIMSVTGLVIQDVVADAMSTRWWRARTPDGSPRTKADIDHDLGMVQVLGRLALAFGVFLRRWDLGLAGRVGFLLHGLSVRAHRTRGLDLGCPARTPRDQRAQEDGLAHPRWRPAVRGFRRRHGAEQHRLQPGDHLCGLHGRGHLDARPRDARGRSRHAHARRLCGHHHLRLSRNAVGG
jgi:hypothetical protein